MIELTCITDEQISEIADRHGVILCECCWQPQLLHVGFNHKDKMCSIDTSGISLALKFPDERRRTDAIRWLNSYFSDLTSADEAEAQRGAAI